MTPRKMRVLGLAMYNPELGRNKQPLAICRKELSQQMRLVLEEKGYVRVGPVRFLFSAAADCACPQCQATLGIKVQSVFVGRRRCRSTHIKARYANIYKVMDRTLMYSAELSRGGA